jgi:hypothetical protein
MVGVEMASTLTYRVTPEFVDLVYRVRTAQRLYFTMARDRSGRWQPHEVAKQLQLCKSLEQQLDEWVKLYNEERERWESFTDGNISAGASAGEASQAELLPAPDAPTHTHSF